MQGTPHDLCQHNDDFVDLVGVVEESDAFKCNKSFNRQDSETFSIQSMSSASTVDHDTMEKDKGLQLEASSKGKVKGSLSMHYFRAGGHWSMLFGMGFLFVFVQFVGSTIDYWVSVWSV